MLFTAMSPAAPAAKETPGTSIAVVRREPPWMTARRLKPHSRSRVLVFMIGVSFALISEAASITDGERGGKVAMGVGLGTQSVGLGLKYANRVCPGRKAYRGRIALGQRHERTGELHRVAALFAVHARPG